MVLNRVQHLTRNRVVIDSYTHAVARVHYDFNPRSETVRTWERGFGGYGGVAGLQPVDASYPGLKQGPTLHAPTLYPPYLPCSGGARRRPA